MKNITLMGYGTAVSITLLLASFGTVYASEITGTLSSDTIQNSLTAGNIDGTVSSISSSGSGGSRSNGNLSNAPTGFVLSASDSIGQIPTFPNAGTSPEETFNNHSLWLTIKIFFGNLLSF